MMCSLGIQRARSFRASSRSAMRKPTASSPGPISALPGPKYGADNGRLALHRVTTWARRAVGEGVKSCPRGLGRKGPAVIQHLGLQARAAQRPTAYAGVHSARDEAIEPALVCALLG